MNPESVTKALNTFEQISQNNATLLGLTNDQAQSKKVYSQEELIQRKKEFYNNYLNEKTAFKNHFTNFSNSQLTKEQLEKNALAKRSSNLWSLGRDGLITAGGVVAYVMMESDALKKYVAIPVAGVFGILALFDGKNAYNAHQEYRGAEQKVKERDEKLNKIKETIEKDTSVVAAEKVKEIETWIQEQDKMNTGRLSLDQQLKASEIELNKAKAQHFLKPIETKNL